MSAGTKRYPQEMKARAVQMVIDTRGGEESEWATISRVADLLGIGSPETVRKSLRQAEIDSGSRLGATTEESVELKRLKRENAELRRANAILKAASTFLRPSCAPRGQVYREVVRVKSRDVVYDVVV